MIKYQKVGMAQLKTTALCAVYCLHTFITLPHNEQQMVDCGRSLRTLHLWLLAALWRRRDAEGASERFCGVVVLARRIAIKIAASELPRR